MTKNLVLCPIWSLWHKFESQNFLSWILPLLDVRNCSKLSLYDISRKTNEPNLRKWQKLSFGPNFGTFSPNLGPKNFFHGFYLHQMLDIVAGYHCMQFQGKLMNRTSENDKIVLAQIWVPKKIFVDFTFARC